MHYTFLDFDCFFDDDVISAGDSSTSDFDVFSFLAVLLLDAAGVFVEFFSSSELLSSELLLESAFGSDFGAATCADSFEFDTGAFVFLASLSAELSEELEDDKSASVLATADWSADFGVVAGV